ncbi:MAG: 50S ribosomal protein L29 [bacterium]
MKRKDRESLRNLSSDEMKAGLRQARDRIFRLGFKRISAPVSNPLELRQLRRKAAMLETWIREHEIKQAADSGRVTPEVRGTPVAGSTAPGAIGEGRPAPAQGHRSFFRVRPGGETEVKKA